MKRVDCEHEPEVLAAVIQSRWPERVDVQLREHVSACPICSDVVVIAGAFDEARDEMRGSATIPDAGRVWWRCQLRARREAAQAAGRPIAAAQIVAVICAIVLLACCLGALAAWYQSAFGHIAVDVKASLDFATTLLLEHGFLVLAITAVVLAVPTAVYLALGKD